MFFVLISTIQHTFCIILLHILFFVFFVLAPPSPPVCTIKGQPEYGHNINLTCKSEEGSPQPTTKWKTFSVENTPRAFPPKAFECRYLALHFSFVSIRCWQAAYSKSFKSNHPIGPLLKFVLLIAFVSFCSTRWSFPSI